jgi:hypothetical protein
VSIQTSITSTGTCSTSGSPAQTGSVTSDTTTTITVCCAQ